MPFQSGVPGLVNPDGGYGRSSTLMARRSSMAA